MTDRPVSSDFIRAMEEKLRHGRNMGRTGWDTHWLKISVSTFGMPSLIEKLEEEVKELLKELKPMDRDLNAIRLEAADIANVAMMIADLAGTLDE